MFFYNQAIKIYGLLIFAFSKFNSKANLFLIGRKNWRKRYAEQFTSIKNPIWVHCSSLGEFEQGRPLIEWMKEKYPSQSLIVTFFSPSGFEIQKNYKKADAIFYLPLDTQQNAIDFIELLQPSLVVFVKYEFWLNYLFELQKRKIPTLLISSKFRSNQIFFRWYGKIFQKGLATFNQIFVQDNASKIMLKKIGIENTIKAYDTRFDRVYHNSLQVKLPDCIHQFCASKKIIVVGSSWAADEDILCNWMKYNLPTDWKIIWVPHEINVTKIKQLQSKISTQSLLFSEINQTEKLNLNAQHLIVDTIGLLSKIYSIANIAYIGGGFGSGIHNILEPAVFGMPIIFGPKYQKFNEAIDLIKDGAAFSFKNENEFEQFFKKLLSDENEILQKSNISKQYVQLHLGGTKAITDYLIANSLI
jgi:3-deoxy-D-manno-octulosonic-acid transferase